MASHIGRRKFLATLLGGAAAAWPLAARAQQADRIRQVGVLIGVADDAQGRARLAAFHKGMQELGWTEGRDIQFETRFTGGDGGRVRAYSAELVAMKPDAILGNTAAVVSALQQQTRTIPIVFVQVLDPVSSGFVESLARPGGNITGFSSYDFGLGAKWPELLKDVAPSVTTVGVLRDPSIPGGSGALGAMQAVASSLKVELVALDVREAVLIERGLAAFVGVPGRGLIVVANPGAIVHAGLIIALATRYRLPAVYPYRFFTANGRPDLLWQRQSGRVAAGRVLCGSHPQRREPGHPAGAAADQVRTGDQSQNREGARPRSTAHASRPRRRGD
jgi:putative tryptophan/tyrosine transport system substrate-binding protein